MTIQILCKFDQWQSRFTVNFESRIKCTKDTVCCLIKQQHFLVPSPSPSPPKKSFILMYGSCFKLPKSNFLNLHDLPHEIDFQSIFVVTSTQFTSSAENNQLRNSGRSQENCQKGQLYFPLPKETLLYIKKHIKKQET